MYVYIPWLRNACAAVFCVCYYQDKDFMKEKNKKIA